MTKIRAMGDLDNGTYDTGLAFENVSVDDDQMVRFSYTIINNGHSDPNALEKALLKTAPGLAKQAGDAVDPLLGQLFNWLVTEIGTALFADCDGPVAASVHQFSGAQLRDGTNSSGTVSHNDRMWGLIPPRSAAVILAIMSVGAFEASPALITVLC